MKLRAALRKVQRLDGPDITGGFLTLVEEERRRRRTARKIHISGPARAGRRPPRTGPGSDPAPKRARSVTCAALTDSTRATTSFSPPPPGRSRRLTCSREGSCDALESDQAGHTPVSRFNGKESAHAGRRL